MSVGAPAAFLWMVFGLSRGYPNSAGYRRNMAKVTVTTLIDDLTREKAHERILFGLDGAHYEIDLSAENARQMRERLTPFIDAAQRRERVSGGRRARRATSGGPVRAWGRLNGYAVSSMGRIPVALTAAYREAHPGR